MFYLCFGTADEEDLGRRRAWQDAAGFPSEVLSRGRLLALEPNANRRASLGVRFANDARVDNARLAEAYAAAARNAGAKIVEGAEVEAVIARGGKIAGVRTRDDSIACDAVVNSAGAWAASFAVGLAVPVTPVRGQIAVVRAARPPFRHAMYSPRGYAVARRDGRVLLGSTRESVGFDKAVTGGGLRSILGAALEISPVLAGLPYVTAWSGLRPATPDGRPIIARDPTVDGYFLACGHYRNGVLLTPLTARFAVELLQGREDPMLSALALTRFHGAAENVERRA
jgi:glycine oxidase